MAMLMTYEEAHAGTYPEAQYRGESGEATATYRPAEHLPELIYPNGTRCHYLATGKTTRGLFGLYRWEMAANASGPGPHFHRTMTESFYVLSGSVKIYNGSEWIDAFPGDYILVREGGLHGFRNDTDRPASMLIHFAPGAPREDYFEGMARLAREGRQNSDEADEFRRQHDQINVSE
jgi:quercetin dioxygenase-like cupin family protein